MRSPWMMLVVVAVCAAVLALLIYFAVSARRQEPPTVVLGEEMLRASQAEERRKARGGAVASPVPAGDYEFSAAELGLINPQPNAFEVGAEPFETTQGLLRFEQGLAGILRRHAKS